MNYEKAFAQSLKYFNGDELAANVFLSKYALTDQEGDIKEATPNDMHKRISSEFARIEAKYPNPMSEDEIYKLLKDFKYIVPQGSPMSAIGNDYQIQSLSNCFVIESPHDSYSGIMHADQQLVQLMKRRAGVGLDISKIRPKGMITNNAAKTTDGIGVFMERFSNSCREVAQNGRRGAELMSISVHHPEVETFAKIKNDPLKVTGANISIKLTEEFMVAVRDNKDYQLRWPVDSDDPVVTETIPARQVWDTIINSAHNRAEPGIFFWDNVAKWTPSDAYPKYKSVTTNPCQPGFAHVLDQFGLKTMEDLKVGDKIWSEDGWVTVINKVETGIKEVFEFKTKYGSFYSTAEHRVVANGKKIEVKDTNIIDLLPNKKAGLATLLTHEVTKGYPQWQARVEDGREFSNILNDETKTDLEIEEGLPSYVWDSALFAQGFLRGIFDESAHITHEGSRLYVNTRALPIAEKLQLLLSQLGVISSIVATVASNLNNVYRLEVMNKGTFVQKIGFSHSSLTHLLDLDTGVVPGEGYIKEVTSHGEMPVYDITVDGAHHTYWSNGFNVSNCGEIVLSPNDSCRLLVLNTISFINEPFSQYAHFDKDKFYDYAQKAQRLMDDIIDLELEKIDRILEKIESDPEPDHVKKVEFDLWSDIRETCERGRRTGLGVTAIGDAVAAMNLIYGSDESIVFVEEMYKTLAMGAYRSSVDMARDRGAFPEYDYELEKDHPFINRIMDEDVSLRQDWEKVGRRNVALTTTAPTGSVSILTQTTSGIEPAFMTSYTRRKKVNPDSKEDVRIDFTDEIGDKWQEFTVYHHGVKTWMDITGETDITESPYHGGTANDIDWINRVKIQGAAQKWICHSISSTVNLPEDVSVDTVKEIYLTAWQEGLKGITVYREGSRSGVLVDSSKLGKDKTAAFASHDAPKRPEELDCDVHQMTVKSEKWMMFVGLLDNKPYEIMGGLSEYISLPKRVKMGKIKKVKVSNGSRYDFHYDHLKKVDSKDLGDGKHQITYVEDPEGETVIKDIQHSFDNATEAAFTRTLSLSLRHGADPQFVVEQLQKGAEKDDDLFAFSKAASRVLKNYIVEGAANGKTCEECGSENIVYQEGCLACQDCGSSKCG
jgi:ribonucleotide reductase alpha subunit